MNQSKSTVGTCISMVQYDKAAYMKTSYERIKKGDIVEYQGRCWIVVGKERSLFGGAPVYHLVPPGDPSRVHAVPRVAFSRVGPWR